jgi:glutaredoxin|tara:strand:- start:9397 stop:9645 length:249 start_codon:yes stop_codon:yes gene_type:complete
MLTLFTKDNCVYCHFLEEKLDDWGTKYTKINNQPLPDGHKTYPQLYYKHHDIQLGASTDLTLEKITSRVKEIDWLGSDGGVE